MLSLFSFRAPIVEVGQVRRLMRRGGRVVMQRPAKPCTPVRFRPPPPVFLFIELLPQGL